jgi:hypothetical protein
MSFELKISFATKAELVAFLSGAAGAAQSTDTKVGAGTPDPKHEAKKPEAKAAPKPEVKVEKPAATISSPKPEESAAAGEQTTDYPTLQAAVFKAAKINKAATLAIATELGSATFKELASELWGTALAKVQALIDQAEVA